MPHTQTSSTSTAPAGAALHAAGLLAQLREHRGLLRFTVAVGDRQVSAFLSDGVWQARWTNSLSDASLTERYQANRSLIDAAVARRVQSGARVPVVLRPSDF
jgi:hypothetical protein